MATGFEIGREVGARIQEKHRQKTRAEYDAEFESRWTLSPEAKARAVAEAKVDALRRKAQNDPKLCHTFGDDREFFVSGIEVYKNDIRVRWREVYKPKDKPHSCGVRGLITERSRKSRKNLSFTVSNTATKIEGMIVLTWRVPPMDGQVVKRQLGDFFDALRRRVGKEIEWLWWLEFQPKRKAPHVHILTAGPVHQSLGSAEVMRTKWRDGKRVKVPATVYIGDVAEFVGQKWLRVIGADECAKSQRFTRQGIWEKFLKPDGAARYCSKDAAKKHQCKVPAEYQNVGAWWHHSRGFETPEMISELVAGEAAVRAGLKLKKGKLYPVLFGKTRDLKK